MTISTSRRSCDSPVGPADGPGHPGQPGQPGQPGKPGQPLDTAAAVIRIPGTPVLAYFGSAADGDMRGLGAELLERRAVAAGAGERLRLPSVVVSARQVHGASVHIVDGAGREQEPPVEADALVCDRPAVAVGVLTADCAPIALGSPQGVFAAVHAGWRGLVAGVIEAAVGSMRDLGAAEVSAVLGACIHPCCYEFSHTDLMAAEKAFGAGLAATSRNGRPALDLPRGVEVALARAGATLVGAESDCSCCAEGWFSYRARRDSFRQGVLVWREVPAGAGGGE